jgi:hypothetical protein
MIQISLLYQIKNFGVKLPARDAKTGIPAHTETPVVSR